MATLARVKMLFSKTVVGDVKHVEAWEKEKVSIVGDTGKGEGEKRSLGNLRGEREGQCTHKKTKLGFCEFF